MGNHRQQQEWVELKRGSSAAPSFLSLFWTRDPSTPSTQSCLVYVFSTVATLRALCLFSGFHSYTLSPFPLLSAGVDPRRGHSFFEVQSTGWK